MVTDDDLLQAFSNSDVAERSSNIESAASVSQSSNNVQSDSAASVSQPSNSVQSDSNLSSSELEQHEHSIIQHQRKRAHDGLVKQAERMIKRSRTVNQAGNPGDNVTVPIPLVDRGRGDPRNLM